MSDTLKGVVKWFNDAKGFGFIEHSSGKDVFVHYSVIQSDGFKTLKDGEVVEYEVSEGPKGLHAQKVQRVAEVSAETQADAQATDSSVGEGAASSHGESAVAGQTTTRVAQAGGFTIAVDSSSDDDSEDDERAAELAALEAKKEELSSRLE